MKTVKAIVLEGMARDGVVFSKNLLRRRWLEFAGSWGEDTVVLFVVMWQMEC